jgi:hypothetical protein
VDRDQAYRTSLELVASQISRGSKDSTASIVSTTTAAKKNSPSPGSTDMSGLVPARTARFDAHERHRRTLAHSDFLFPGYALRPLVK